MPLSPGSRLGPYEILGALGSGGMGEVYRARDPRLGGEVTHLGARNIDGPTPLADGDEIGIGTAVLIFLGPAGTGSTETA